MASVPKAIGDFSVLPISIPPLPAYPYNVIHYVYARRNSPKVPSVNDSRSLFLTNVPVDSTEAHFRAIFSNLVGSGRFEGITFESDKASASASLEPAQAARLASLSRKRKRNDSESDEEDEKVARIPETWSRRLMKSGSTAVVLLADEKSVDAVFKAIAKAHKTKKYPVWGDSVGDKVPVLGSPWLKAHNRLSYPDKEAIQQSVDAFFTLFNKKERVANELAKRLRNEPDEDGFVTVTRGGRNAPARSDEAEEARKKMLEKQEKKKTEMTNFYRFQLRERKKAEQAELLKRFEEDRKKVHAMKEKRGKFRPEA